MTNPKILSAEEFLTALDRCMVGRSDFRALRKALIQAYAAQEQERNSAIQRAEQLTAILTPEMADSIASIARFPHTSNEESVETLIPAALREYSRVVRSWAQPGNEASGELPAALQRAEQAEAKAKAASVLYHQEFDSRRSLQILISRLKEALPPERAREIADSEWFCHVEKCTCDSSRQKDQIRAYADVLKGVRL